MSTEGRTGGAKTGGRKPGGQNKLSGDVNPSSRIGGFFECALVVDQRVKRKGLHYRGISDIASMTILAGSRGAL